MKGNKFSESWTEYFNKYGWPTKNKYGENFTDNEDFDDFVSGLLRTLKITQIRIDDLEEKVRILEGKLT